MSRIRAFFDGLFRRIGSRPPRRPDETFIDAVFGECQYDRVSNSWTSHTTAFGGGTILVRGRGHVPTVDQIMLWRQLPDRMPQLVLNAREGLLRLSTDDLRAESSDIMNARLEEVRFESGGILQLFFDLEVFDSSGCARYPMVTFENWSVTESEWVI